ncbi:hypothetical protein HF086_018247 [Spodoptera exigua]|uniref:Uncharacterized protein n=1 Tax=Spodoptera exigua TaxID=7107 RepID=A0A922M1U9_SPOEX|nr:hypothetical protein HF086_018247 [Spodoptera exigua]
MTMDANQQGNDGDQFYTIYYEVQVNETTPPPPVQQPVKKFKYKTSSYVTIPDFDGPSYFIGWEANLRTLIDNNGILINDQDLDRTIQKINSCKHRRSSVVKLEPLPHDFPMMHQYQMYAPPHYGVYYFYNSNAGMMCHYPGIGFYGVNFRRHIIHQGHIVVGNPHFGYHRVPVIHFQRFA